MKRWQIGYRLLSEIEARPCGTQGARYYTPYHDFPEFDSEYWLASAIHNQLIHDFPTAEWRLVEVK